MATCIHCGDWFEGGSPGEQPVCAACRSSFAFPPARPASTSSPIDTQVAAFDPYHTWLGIPPAKQPPNHYQLLGLAHLEDNADVIATAADRQSTHLHFFLRGPYARDAERLIAQLDAACVCLLNEHTKAAYDEVLSQVESASSMSAFSRVAPAMQPAAETSHAPALLTSHKPRAAAPPRQDMTTNARRRPAKPKPSPVLQLVQIVGGGIAGCAIGYYLGFVLLPSLLGRDAEKAVPPKVEMSVRSSPQRLPDKSPSRFE